MILLRAYLKSAKKIFYSFMFQVICTFLAKNQIPLATTRISLVASQNPLLVNGKSTCVNEKIPLASSGNPLAIIFK